LNHFRTIAVGHIINTFVNTIKMIDVINIVFTCAPI
jgi:hypothetical protein